MVLNEGLDYRTRKESFLRKTEDFSVFLKKTLYLMHMIANFLKSGEDSWSAQSFPLTVVAPINTLLSIGRWCFCLSLAEHPL